MSNYGEDTEMSIPAAQDITFTKAFNPVEDGFVNQFTLADNVVVRHIVSDKGNTNLHIKIQQ